MSWDVFILRPTLDELVNQENAILLSNDQCKEQHCELLIQLYPHYKIQSFSLVCNVNKVEVFQGNLKEYLETVYGVLEDCDDEQFKSYRYDVEVEKSGITELTIKFLTCSEVCLFGIILQTAPNPNGITTLLPAVQNLLSSTSPLTPASEKCKKIFELMTKVNSRPLFTADAFAELPNSQQDIKQKSNLTELQNMATGTEDLSESSKNDRKITLDKDSLQNYIDTNFRKMEERLNHRLLLMEKRQMEKFDCILKLLENLKRN